MPHQVAHRSVHGEGTYKGIPYFATRGLHDDVEATMLRYADLNPSSQLVLDVGAGRGAFSRRLADRGFKVEAIELDATDWMAPEVQVHSIDFCEVALPPKIRDRYDFILSIEVIEHVADPSLFLGNIASALKPNGLAIVTTPAVNTMLGVALLAWKGELPLFSFKNYWSTGHRNILPDFLLSAFAMNAGLEVLEMNYGGRITWNFKLMLSLLPLSLPLIWQRTKFAKRWNKACVIAVFQKKYVE